MPKILTSIALITVLANLGFACVYATSTPAPLQGSQDIGCNVIGGFSISAPQHVSFWKRNISFGGSGTDANIKDTDPATSQKAEITVVDRRGFNSATNAQCAPGLTLSVGSTTGIYKIVDTNTYSLDLGLGTYTNTDNLSEDGGVEMSSSTPNILIGDIVNVAPPIPGYGMLSSGTDAPLVTATESFYGEYKLDLAVESSPGNETAGDKVVLVVKAGSGQMKPAAGPTIAAPSLPTGTFQGDIIFTLTD